MDAKKKKKIIGLSPVVAVTRVTCGVTLITGGNVSGVDQMIKHVRALIGICHSYDDLRPAAFVGIDSVRCRSALFVCCGSRR